MLRRREHRRGGGEEPIPSGPGAPAAVPLTSPAAADKLLNDLHAIWKEASGGGVSQAQYSACLQRAVEQSYGTEGMKKRKRKRRSCCCLVFDCLWTVVLVLLVMGLIVAFCEPISFFLQRNLHTKVYEVNRAARFAFLRVAPYLDAIGLDFTQLCLLPNPFVNESTRCPCIKSMDVLEGRVRKEGDRRVLPSAVINSNQHIYAVREAMEVGEEYGRGTLVQYMDQYGTLPNMCVQTGDSSSGVGPYNLMDVVQERRWEELVKGGGAWDMTW